ncbi:Pyruvate phosphate dikinase, PEP/pyruvate binding domain, partial [Pleodorina starrii]
SNSSEREERETDLLGAAALFRPPPRLSDALLRPADRHPLPLPLPAAGAGAGATHGSGRPVGQLGASWMLDHIVQREPSAERSLMHRYNAGADLVEMAGGSGEAAEALAAVTAWLRFSASRLLVWNRNYNVKPREISTAQARLAAALAALGAARGPAAAAAAAATGGGGGGSGGSAAVGALVRVALAAVGRGGAGEVGQRIRDEILAIQQRNGCKGGMMEEWHQKLHNNTSPDDVVICRALLDYIAAGLDITAYWRTLSSAGISAQRLASFDRPIVSEPRFSGQQAAGLQRDLTAYLQTLQAVHGGDDLASAINNVLGYEETDMKGKRISVPAVPHVVTPTLERHLRALLALQRHLASPAAAAAATAAATAAAAAAAAPLRGGSTPPAAGVKTTAAAPAVVPGGGAGAAVAAAAAAHRPTDVASLYGLPGAVRLMEMVVEARHLIRPFMEAGDAACGGRLVDVMFLDLALDSALRTAVESILGPVKRAIADGTGIYIAAAAAAAGPTGGNGAAASGAAARAGGVGTVVGGGSGVGLGAGGRPLAGAFAAAAALTQALEVVRLTTENAALSCTPNDDLVYSNKWLRLLVAQEDPRDARDRMLQSLAITERLKRNLADQGAALLGLMQPPADELGRRLKLAPEAVSCVGEEVVRGSSGAPLAQLLAWLEPALRQATGGGAWQIVSRGSDRPVLAGRLRVEPRLAAVQHEIMREPTVLLVQGITGAEEIPEGCVAVLVGGGGAGCPDVLSHSAVRARNMGVLLAGCYSGELVTKIRSHAGSRVMVRLEGADVQISFSSTGNAAAAAAAAPGGAAADGSAGAAGDGGAGGGK